MTPATTINVLGLPYTITWVASGDVDHSGEQASLWGQRSERQHSIRICADAPPERQRQVLMHEILHAVVSGLDIRALIGDDDVHHEAAIQQLSVGLVSALESLGLRLPTGGDSERASIEKALIAQARDWPTHEGQVDQEGPGSPRRPLNVGMR